MWLQRSVPFLGVNQNISALGEFIRMFHRFLLLEDLFTSIFPLLETTYTFTVTDTFTDTLTDTLTFFILFQRWFMKFSLLFLLEVWIFERWSLLSFYFYSHFYFCKSTKYLRDDTRSCNAAWRVSDWYYQIKQSKSANKKNRPKQMLLATVRKHVNRHILWQILTSWGGRVTFWWDSYHSFEKSDHFWGPIITLT